MINWIIRFFKGIIIGTGFILPGVSGGVLAAILGIYERMIRFLADIRKDFVKNIRFFLPMGIGVIASMIICSFLLSTFFDIAEIQLIWLFIGCVVATIPILYKEAGKNGRKAYHYLILAGTAVAMYLFLINAPSIFGNITPPVDNLLTWVLAGVLMGLGAIVPGLSPSNFLLYLNMYQPMTDRIKDLNVLVILAILAGAAICFLLFSKAVKYLFDHVYAGLFHSILGIIVASTLAIIPRVKNGIYINGDGIETTVTTAGLMICAVTFIAGVGIGVLMAVLEKKYKKED